MENGIPGDPFLVADDIDKSFGGAVALSGAGLTLHKGRVHALVGANGAGKSTLARIIAGHLTRDRGRISIGGRPTEIKNPREAINLGVVMVNQQLSLAPDLSAAENIMLTELCRPRPWRPGRILAQAEEVMSALMPRGGIDLRQAAGRLPMAQKQMVEIAKALSQNPEIIIFDEPTTSLTPNEVERLFDIMRKLTGQGKGLVFVSHRMEEIFAITDQVTVLRDGRNICRSLPTAGLDQAALVRLMIGRDLDSDIYKRRPAAERVSAARAGTGETVLKVEKLVSGSMVRGVSFELRQGEILGLAGLVGAGRTETARALFGLERVSSGRVEIMGRPYTPKNPARAYRRGLAMIPEDRRVEGVIPDFLVRENIQLTRMSLFNRFLTGYKKAAARLLRYTRRLELPDGHLDKYVTALSGGQQQKALVSRVLMVEPRILIVDEPTQGVDVATRSEIYALLRELSEGGLSIIMISSDFEELLGLSDRIIVLTEGRVTADIPAGLVDEEKLTMFAAPRASAEGTGLLLRELAGKMPGAAVSWIYTDQRLVYCFDQTESPDQPDPGFKAGQIVPLAETCLAAGPGEDGRWRLGEALSSLILPLRNAKGHELGLLAVTVRNGDRAALDPAALEALAARRPEAAASIII